MFSEIKKTRSYQELPVERWGCQELSVEVWTKGVLVDRRAIWTLSIYAGRMAKDTSNSPEALRKKPDFWKGLPFAVEVTNYDSLMKLVERSEDSQRFAAEVKATYELISLLVNRKYDEFDIEKANNLKKALAKGAIDERGAIALLCFVQYYQKTKNISFLSIFCGIAENYNKVGQFDDDSSENSQKVPTIRKVIQEIVKYKPDLKIEVSQEALILILVVLLLCNPLVKDKFRGRVILRGITFFECRTFRHLNEYQFPF